MNLWVHLYLWIKGIFVLLVHPRPPRHRLLTAFMRQLNLLLSFQLGGGLKNRYDQMPAVHQWSWFVLWQEHKWNKNKIIIGIIKWYLISSLCWFSRTWFHFKLPVMCWFVHSHSQQDAVWTPSCAQKPGFSRSSSHFFWWLSFLPSTCTNTSLPLLLFSTQGCRDILRIEASQSGWTDCGWSEMVSDSVLTNWEWVIITRVSR